MRELLPVHPAVTVATMVERGGALLLFALRCVANTCAGWRMALDHLQDVG